MQGHDCLTGTLLLTAPPKADCKSAYRPKKTKPAHVSDTLGDFSAPAFDIHAIKVADNRRAERTDGNGNEENRGLRAFPLHRWQACGERTWRHLDNSGFHGPRYLCLSVLICGQKHLVPPQLFHRSDPFHPIRGDISWPPLAREKPLRKMKNYQTNPFRISKSPCASTFYERFDPFNSPKRSHFVVINRGCYEQGRRDFGLWTVIMAE